MQHDYYFYASFENSICKDYFTEKLFTPLKFNLIPIAINGAYRNLSTIVPENSFIFANSFKSIAELAQELKTIASNSSIYSNYFQWKQKFNVKRNVSMQALCSLCAKLNTINDEKEDQATRIISDMKNWLIDESQCRKTIFDN